MISYDEALQCYTRTLGNALDTDDAAIRRRPPIKLPIAQALHHVLATEVYAATDLPRFDQSAMDGYAFRAEDVRAATAIDPLSLPIGPQLAANGYGEWPTLPSGQAARILTGAPIPAGATTVIPQERIERVGNQLHFVSAYPSGRNIRRQGEELRRGDRLASRGQRLTPGLLAALINADIETVDVYPRPRIRVLISGDELRPVGSPLRFGEIHDSNGPLVSAVLNGWHLHAESIDTVADQPEAVRDALRQALQDADLVITCGGASVGDKDYLPASARALGVQEQFWRIAQKPGKPMWYGTHAGGTMLALPGNPGAVLIGMALHVKTVLDRLERQLNPGPQWGRGVLTETVERDSGRERLMRMQLQYDDSGMATLTPLHHQDSHMLSNLANADVLVRVAAGDDNCLSGSVLPWTTLP